MPANNHSADQVAIGSLYSCYRDVLFGSANNRLMMSQNEAYARGRSRSQQDAQR